MKSVDSRILAVIACLLWSTAFLGVKTGLQYMPPLFFAGIRFTLAGVAVGLIFRRPGYLKQLRKHWRVMLLIGLFQTFGLYSLFYFSLNNMRASTGAILNGLGPLVTALMAHFFMPGDRLTSRKFLSMLLGVASVVLVSGSGMATRGSVDSGELMGILLMSASLLVSGTAVILVARSSDELDPFILNSVQLTFGGLLLLSAGILTGALPRSIPPVHFYFALIWLVGVTSGGFSIWYYLLKIRKEQVSNITVWKFLNPVGGALLSWLFIGNDSPDLLSLGGMVLTAFAIMLFYSKRSKKVCLEKEGR